MKTDQKRVKKMNWRMVLILVVLVCTIWAGSETAVYATAVTNADWTRPQRIPGYDPETGSPRLVADQDQTVHAFSSQSVGDKLVVVYSQWTPQRSWTIPVDIILPPFKGQARVSSVVLDDDGIFHMVFFSGDDLGANIYYTRALAIHAGRATAWSAPVSIGPGTITPTVAELLLLQSGELVLVYSSRLHGQGLYAVYSFDKGETWSAPEPFFLTYDRELWPTPLELFEDSNSRLHALWGVADRSGNRLAIYYSRLDSPTKQWETAFLFAEAIDFEANTPAMIEHNEQLLVVYNNNLPTTRWTRRSSDGGETWTDPVRVSGHVGTNGPPSMIIDGHGELHMFFANRIGNPAIHGVWHTTWQEREQRWREPEPVISGLRVTGRVGGNGFDPSFVKATLVQGNIFLLTWVTDPGAGRNGVWYTFTRLNTPALPRQPLPEPTPVPTSTPLLIEDLSQRDGNDFEVPLGLGQELEMSESNQNDYARILFVSTVPAGLFILIIVGLFSSRVWKRR